MGTAVCTEAWMQFEPKREAWSHGACGRESASELSGSAAACGRAAPTAHEGAEQPVAGEPPAGRARWPRPLRSSQPRAALR